VIDNSPQARVKSNITHREAKLSENKAVFFSLLSESIYTYGRLAGVREIISNALDATVRAKSSRPIQIKCPTSLQPSFSVRDYGPGLTDQEIDDLYTCLGASSKKEVEDEVGFFGVGALSPFAYVESFNVQSFKDGLVRLYSIFMNEKGVPDIAFINESKTDEPNGLCVSYNVKREDIGAFGNDIDQTLTYIEPDKYLYGKKVPYYKDVIKADKNIVMNFDDKIFISAKQYYGSNQKNQLVMGGVCYEFDPSFVNKDLFQRYVVTIEAPIGAVSVQASREKLKLNTKTTAYIKEIVNYIYKNIEAEVQKQVDAADNFWAALNIVQRMTIVNLKDMKWRGYSLDIKWFLEQAKGDFTIKVKNRGKKFQDYVANNWGSNINFMNNIVLDDTKKGGLGRIGDHCNYSPVVFIQTTEERTNKFIEKFGNFFHERASKLPEPVRAVTARKSKKKTYEFLDANAYGGFTFASRTKEFLEDYEKFDGYYVVCKNRVVIYGDKAVSLSDVFEARKLTNKKVIIIDWESDKPPNGSCFLDFFSKKYFSAIEDNYKATIYNRILNNSKYLYLFNTRKDFKNEVEKFKVTIPKITAQNAINLASPLGLKLPDNITNTFTEKIDKVIEDNYPLMMALDYRAYQKPLSVHLDKYLLTGDQEAFKNCINY
jgi:hypothetical protein